MTLSMTGRHLLAVLGWLATLATSLSLYPALQEKRYFLIGGGLSALVVVLAMVARQLHVPTAVIVVGQLVLVSDIMLVAYGGHTWQGVVPTSTTFRSVANVLSDGMDVAQRYAAPVPHSPGLMLMTVAFIAYMAIAVDLLAASLARAPLAGLPLLALYTVPVAALPNGVPAWAFVPGAAAFLALLMVAEHGRLTHWGRHVARSTGRGSGDAIDTSALSAAGRRISMLAVTTAVVLPLLLPGFSHTLFHGKSGIGNGSGGKISFNDPMVSLAVGLHRKDPLDLVEVTSGTAPSYLRLAVLDHPGPNAWTSSGFDISSTLPPNVLLPEPPGLSSSVPTTPASMAVTLTSDFPSDSQWLPVPFAIKAVNLSLQGGGLLQDFAYLPRDQTLTSRTEGAVTLVAGYTTSYKVVSPTEDQLDNAPPAPTALVTSYAKVPAGVPDVVAQVARNVTADATNDYQRALALQSFFRDNASFTYDLGVGYGYGYRAMARFLEVRRGFCQQFAATMAMMARELRIPSRVVVGFLDPSKHTGDDDYTFTSQDAHAWPELYFNGVGWVRFEPTPGNGAVIPGYTQIVRVPTVNPTDTTPTSTGAQGQQGKQTDLPSTSAAPSPTNAGAGGGGGGTEVPSVGWLVLAVLAGLLLAPAAVRAGLRRSRLARAIDGGPSCEYAWLELRDRIIDLGMPWTGSLTPRARQRFVEPLLGGDPDGVAALDRLSLTLERSRYAGTPVPDARPASDVEDVMSAVTQGADRLQRVRAFLWPASLIPSLRTGWGRVRSRPARRAAAPSA